MPASLYLPGRRTVPVVGKDRVSRNTGLDLCRNEVIAKLLQSVRTMGGGCRSVQVAPDPLILVGLERSRPNGAKNIPDTVVTGSLTRL